MTDKAREEFIFAKWFSVGEQGPPMDIKPDGADPDSEYTWTIGVIIKIAEGDRFSMRLYPSGEAPAYFDHEDGAWHWDEYSGGPSLTPTHWRYQ